mgnify:CR=1 FL=1
MGKLLLGKIGVIYFEQAMQQLGGLDSIGANIDEVKGGYRGSPKFPLFNIYEVLLFFFILMLRNWTLI